MRCVECNYEAPVNKFRYLYNARIDDSISMRQCPKCMAWLVVDEFSGEVKQKVESGESPWGKSSGVDGL